MSNLLNEAIVDAKALREAALKNAETIVIEKYSDEVRQTIEKLLEQEEDLGLDPAAAPAEGEAAADPLADPAAADPLADPAAMTMEEGEGEQEEITEDDIPLAATDDFADLDGKNLGQLPSSGEEVELNLNLGALQESVSKLMEETEEEYDINEETIAAILSEEGCPSDEEELYEEDKSDDDEDAIDAASADAKKTPWFDRSPEQHAATAAKYKKDNPGGIPRGTDYDPETEKPQRYKGSSDRMRGRLKEDDDSLEEMVDAIVEKLTVDMGADLSGWAGRSSEDLKYQIEKELAHRRSTDVQEDLEDLKKAQEELVFENNQLTERNNQYKQALQELKESLQDVNLSNARLLYTNRVLRNTSLNERQKEKIVEAISSAGSVAEARTIYETLQSTVEAAPRKSPQSLSEAIGRRSTVLRATRKEAPSNDPFQDRMKRLAGIK